MSSLSNFYHADMEAEESDDEDFQSGDDVVSDIDIDPEDDADMDGFIARDDEEEVEEDARDPEDLADYDEGLTKDDLDLIRENRGEKPVERDRLDEDIDEEEAAPKRKFKKIKKGKRLRKRSLSPDAGSMSALDDDDMIDDDRPRGGMGAGPSKRPRFSDTVDDFVVDDLGEEPGDVDDYRQRAYTGPQYQDGAMMQAAMIFGRGIHEFMKAGVFGSKRSADGDEGAVAPRVPRDIDEFPEDPDKEAEATKGLTAAEKAAIGKKLGEEEERKAVLGSDIPERMQPRLRDANITEMGLMDEASYIKRMAFDKRDRVPESTIREVLKMLLKEKLEIPYIKLYRQGVWSTTDFPLREEDLWTIHDWDQKYFHFSQRKERLTLAVKAVQDESQREAVFRFLEQADTEADLDDVQEFVNAMNENEEKVDEEIDEDGKKAKFKRPRKRGTMLPSVEGIEEFIEVLGPATSLGNSVYHKRQTRTPPNPHRSPRALALGCVTSRLRTPEAVMSAAVKHLAREISLNPNVRRKVREHYFDHARISTVPTRRGRNEIDWMSEYIIVKRIENEPVYSFTEGFRNYERHLEHPDDDSIPGSLPERFALLTAAEGAGLLTSSVTLPEDLKLGEGVVASVELLQWLKSLYCSNSNADGQDEWNKLRTEVLEEALKRYLNIVGKTYVRDTLLAESRRLLGRQVVGELDNRMKIDEFANKGRTIFGFHIGDFDKPSMCCSLNDHGVLVSYEIYHSFKNKIPSKRARERNHELYMNSKNSIKMKMDDVDRFKKFLAEHRPTMVVVGAEDVRSPNVLGDIRNACQSMQPQPRVEFVNPDVARIFQTSTRAEREFPNAPPGLRAAIAMARTVLDPVCELAAMWHVDPNTKQRDILSFQMHHLQRILPEELLLKEIQRVFIDKINHYGVDLNAVVHHPHRQSILQHVCGLGPVMADSLIGKVVGFCHSRRSLQAHNEGELARGLAPSIYKNCIGFLRIVSNKESRAYRPANQDNEYEERDDANEGFQHEYLDSTRIHPESYEYAVQVAWDELNGSASDEQRETELTGLMEYQDKVESLLVRLLQERDQLNELDVATYATSIMAETADSPRAELDRNVHTMLKLFERELFRPFFSSRTPFQSPERQELFWLLTHETPRTLRMGMIVDATVALISREFVVVRLGCGVEGRIYFNCLTEEEEMPSDPMETRQWAQGLVRKDQAIRGRIKNIHFDFQNVDLDCRKSVMEDLRYENAAQFYNVRTFNNYLNLRTDDQILAEEEMKQESSQPSYIQRHVDFPLFKNYDRKQAEKALQSKDVGSIIVRPSSRGLDYLTISWKIASDPFLCVHMEVEEKDKENKYEIGQSLEIGNMKFEDLDEIHANYIEHMTAKLRELTTFSEFRYGTEAEVDQLVSYEKQSNPEKIAYAIGFSIKNPGWFRLVYVFNKTPLSEFIRLQYDGYRFRKRKFTKPNQLINWFKRHPHDGSPFNSNRRRNGHHSSRHHGGGGGQSSSHHHQRSSKYSGYGNDDYSRGGGRSSQYDDYSRGGGRSSHYDDYSRSGGGGGGGRSYQQSSYGGATPSHKHNDRGGGGGYRR